MLTYLTFATFISVLVYSIRGQSCTDGHLHNGRCYRLRAAANWLNAIDDCKSIGAHLFYTDGKPEQEVMKVVLQDDQISGSVWLGANLKTTGNNNAELWRWADETVLAGQGCFEENPSDRDLPYKQDMSSVTHGLCVEQCDRSGFAYAGVQDGDLCYCGDSFGKYQLSTSCTTRCAADVKQRCGGYNKNFIYSTKGTFGQWAYAQPNNFVGNQYCGRISRHVDFKFGDEACAKVFSYMCDVDSSKCDSQSDTATTGYVRLLTKCMFVTNEAANWFNARSDCKNKGGDLLKLDSMDMYNALNARFSSDPMSRSYWIGLHNREWQWTSGVPIIFTNWEENFPLNDSGNCVSAGSSDGYRWRNERCDNVLPYYCVTEPVKSTTAHPSTTTQPPTTTPKTTTTTTTTPTTTATTVVVSTSPTTLIDSPVTSSAATTGNLAKPSLDSQVVTTRLKRLKRGIQSVTTRPIGTTRPLTRRVDKTPTSPTFSRISTTSTTTATIETVATTTVSDTVATSHRVTTRPIGTTRPTTSTRRLTPAFSLTSTSAWFTGLDASSVRSTTPPYRLPDEDGSIKTTSTISDTEKESFTTVRETARYSDDGLPKGTVFIDVNQTHESVTLTNVPSAVSTTKPTSKLPTTLESSQYPTTQTTLSLTTVLTYTPTVTVLTSTQGIDVTIGNNSGSSGNTGVPQTGASTNNSSSLSTVELILIIFCVILLILIIIAIVLLCYFKNNNKTAVGVYNNDYRYKSTIPSSTPYVIDDGYATNSDYGSMAGLVPHKQKSDRYVNQKIQIDDHRFDKY